MSTVSKIWGTRVLCFFKWTQFTRRSQFLFTMGNQSVSLLLLFSILMRCGITSLLCCPLIHTRELNPGCGLILLTTRYVCVCLCFLFLVLVSAFTSWTPKLFVVDKVNHFSSIWHTNLYKLCGFFTLFSPHLVNCEEFHL